MTTAATPEEMEQYVFSQKRTVERISSKHPRPWRYVPHEGTVYMIDAVGKGVELFDILDFAVAATLLLQIEQSSTAN